jgi:tetratricopeptide (TPR) repeat protein
MDNKTHCFFEELYEQLKDINGIEFSRREIDVLPFLIDQDEDKHLIKIIARTLLLANTKAVEPHITQIRKKLGIKSKKNITEDERKYIKNLIEKSGKSSILKKHYLNLQANYNFFNFLKEFNKKPKKESFSACSLIYWEDESSKNSLISQLKRCLEFLGISTNTQPRTSYQPFFQLIQEETNGEYWVYLIPEEWLGGQAFLETPRKNIKISQSPQEAKPCVHAKLFLFPLVPKDEALNDIIGIDYLNISKQKTNFLLFFEVLKRLFPKLNFEKIVAEFNERNEVLTHFSDEEKQMEKKDNFTPPKISFSAPRKQKSQSVWGILQEKRWIIFSFFSLALGSLFGLLAFKMDYSKKWIAITQDQLQSKNHSLNPSIRSDLILPSASVSLDRSELTSKIDKYLNNQKGIRTVALVEMGGAGKTTLARQYGHRQKSNIVWEFNAERPETLRKDFDDLAQKLAKTEEDQKVLRVIGDIKDSHERENRILQFVKGFLKASSNWFLIFDNVEGFSNIQKYFPQDEATWGQGAVIVTTRDNNVQSNKYVNAAIFIGELTPSQKWSLFTKIMGRGISSSSSLYTINETKEFLERVPSFPLDVSLAARYLQITKISYKEYLKRLEELDEEFANIQGNILRDSGDYVKTRYGIITLSLNHLLRTHKDFKDLLVFTTLLDSQNIPRSLLEKIKSPTIVDNFLYHLNKHSLITSNLYPEGIFSIHRSIQTLARTHLVKLLNLNASNAIVNSLAFILEENIDKYLDDENTTLIKSLISHVKTFLSYESLLDDTMKASMKGSLGGMYAILGNYQDSVQLLNESIQNLQKLSEKHYIKIAQISSYLGTTYLMLGDYEKAIHLLEKSLTICKNSLSEKDIKTARILANLGNVYKYIGDYKKSLDLLQRSLITYEKILPKDHPKIGAVFVMLGNVYRELGSYEKSVSLLEKGFKIYKSHFPKSHNGIGWVLCHLGMTYMELQNYAKAKDCFEESLSIHKHQFGEDHIWSKWVLTQLGILYNKMGNPEKGIDLLEANRMSFNKIYGANHIEMAGVLMGLGQAYFFNNNLGKAETCFKKASKIFEKNHHPHNYMVLEALADLYLKKSLQEALKKNFSEASHLKNQAIECLNQSLRILSTYFPENSSHIQKIKNKLVSYVSKRLNYPL